MPWCHSLSVADDTPDAILLQRSADGDKTAFREFVLRHQTGAFRFVRSIVDSQEAAEDVLQETFIAVYRAAGRFEGRAAARTWLLTIARNTALRARKKRALVDAREQSLLDLGVAAGWGSADPERLAIRSQRRAALEQALASMTQEDREILVLRDVQGLSGGEAAEVLGLGLQAMKSRLHRARLKFAAILGGAEHGE